MSTEKSDPLTYADIIQLKADMQVDFDATLTGLEVREDDFDSIRESLPPEAYTYRGLMCDGILITKRVGVEKGQLWSNDLGKARVLEIVPVAGEGFYAVMQATRATGSRYRRPFLKPVSELLEGEEGWVREREK